MLKAEIGRPAAYCRGGRLPSTAARKGGFFRSAANRNQRLRREGFRSRLVLQIHDELLVDAAKEEVDEVSRIKQEEMEGAASLSVALEVDLHTGENWFEAK